mgnify:CR=1 FL=1
MRIGVVSPLTDRGLGTQSWETARNLDASVLFVETKDPSAPSHPERFPNATRVRWAQGLDPRVVIPWLQTVDVVYAAETFYDPRMTKWANANNTATVLHANPEFWTNSVHPTHLWSATDWRREVMPHHTEVVPFPVATDRFTPAEPHDGPCRWVHVAGKRAAWDRNGTDTVVSAIPLLTEPCSLRIVVQHGEIPELPPVPTHVAVTFSPPPADYWRLYDDADALVLPRRYGGLCLPVQEACAAGLAVVMSDLIPNRVWPGPRVPAEFWRKATMPCGRVPVYDVSPRDLAQAMDALADPTARHRFQSESRLWAQDHSWEAQKPAWLNRLSP